MPIALAIPFMLVIPLDWVCPDSGPFPKSICIEMLRKWEKEVECPDCGRSPKYIYIEMLNARAFHWGVPQDLRAVYKLKRSEQRTHYSCIPIFGYFCE